ncbi:MAG: tyrosine-type recombinase/integrase [Bacteroidota bacterium]|nr:tyrosine-type recombinase/integrase [Bacteroidota bacterium]
MIYKFIQYIRDEKRYSEHTVAAYASDLAQYQQYLSTAYESADPAMADFQMIRSWIVRLNQDKISNRSINRKLSTLKSFYRFLIREGVVTTNPLSKIINPKTAKRLPEFLDKSKTEFLFTQVEFEDSPEGHRDKTILELFYATGIRQAELRSLTLDSLDTERMTLKVKGKRNKERFIPLGEQIVQLLTLFIEEYRTLMVKPNQNNFIFVTKDGEPISPRLVNRIVRKYLGLVSSRQKRSPHVLRHTFATHMLENGADLNAIKEILGHSSLAATQVYTHNTIDRLKIIYKQAHPKA